MLRAPTLCAAVLVTVLQKNQTTQLALVSAAGGSAAVLKSLDTRWPGAESFSPDGRLIAYDLRAREDAPERDIFLLTADGRTDAPLVHHAADDGLLGWTRNGGALLMVSDRSGSMDGWEVPVGNGQAAGAPRLVKRDLGRVAPLGFTADGRLFVGSSSGGPDVFVAEVDPGSGTLVAPPTQASERFVGANRYPVLNL